MLLKKGSFDSKMTSELLQMATPAEAEEYNNLMKDLRAQAQKESHGKSVEKIEPTLEEKEALEIDQRKFVDNYVANYIATLEYLHRNRNQSNSHFRLY